MKVYADNAATTKISEAALEKLNNCILENFGNPSSLYRIGQDAKKELEDSREKVASLIGASPKEIFFSSGGSESDNWAIMSAAEIGKREDKKHIISTKFEHHAVLHTLEKLEKQEFEITLLDVYENGIIKLEDLEDAIREDTCLVTIMYANNEIGTVQPIKEIGEICKKHDVLFHTDAVQAIGHLPINVEEENIDMLSASAHKFHGPKGGWLSIC